MKQPGREVDIDALPVAVLVADADLRVMACNQRYHALTGVTPSAAPTVLEALDAIHPDDRNRFVHEWSIAGELGMSFAVSCRLQQRRDATFAYHVIHGDAERDADGRVARWILVAEAGRAERSARVDPPEPTPTGNSLTGHLARVADELRTPLGAILGWSNLLLTGRLRGDRAIHALETIRRMAHVQARLIEKMLSDARPDAAPAQDSVDLTEIVDTAVTALRPLAETRGIVLVNRNLSKPAWTTGDQDRLLQVFWNLLSNAIKFSEAGARVFVAVTRHGDEIVTSVQDSGRGIGREFLPFVFDQYLRAAPGGGLGLGLSTAKQIVVAHGGSIEAMSNGPGTGSVFTVRLHETQRRVDTQVARGTPRLSQRTEKLAGRRVLLVEERDDVRAAIATMLQRCGARVTAARSSDMALAAIASSAPDVLIGAMGMTAPDGNALLRSLEQRCLGHQFAAIALLDDCAGEAPQRARAAGYQACVARSTDATELMSAMAAACGPRHNRS